jgi:hypothetical protein
MEEAVVTLSEAVAIILERGWRNGWIPEPRMAFHAGRFSLRNIAPGSIEAIVIATLGNLVKLRRRRWWRRINNHRPRMRAACQ